MKKILVLAFVSAAFFFGCSADGIVPYSTAEPPEWDGTPEIGPGSSPAVSDRYCSFMYIGFLPVCEKISDEFTTEDCDDFDGTIVISCPDLD